MVDAWLMVARYTQALMAGQGLGGIAVAVLNVVTILVYPSQDHDDIISSAFLFFMVALFVALSCIFTFPILTKLKFVQHKRATVAISVRRASSSNLRAVNSIQKQNSEGMCGEIERPIKAIAPLAFQVGYVFFVTLSVFPAIAAAVKSQYANDYGTKLFVPIFCFVGFNVGDYVGRTLVTFAQWPSLLTRARMWVPVLLRTAFIPLFMMCNLDLGSGVSLCNFKGVNKTASPPGRQSRPLLDQPCSVQFKAALVSLHTDLPHCHSPPHPPTHVRTHAPAPAHICSCVCMRACRS